MATQTLHKIIFNGVLLPDIFFTYDEAKQRLKTLIESSCAGQGRVVNWDDETNQVI